MKFRIIGCSIFMLAVLLIFSRCKSRNADKREHYFAGLDDFKKLSREEQVKKCGSCHEAIYKNEMLGPHAHAYTNLQGHIQFVRSKEYDCQEYKDLLSNGSEKCYTCHTSKDLYQSVFGMKRGDFGIINPKGMRKRDIAMAATGIDCITCHFDGSRVIAGENFKPKAEAFNCPVYCRPVASKFFSSNANCQPCHAEQVDDVELLNKTKHTNLSCASCHEERDLQGKFTHYTYWAHNPKEKAGPEYLNLFNGITADYILDKNEFKIVWRNKYMPHKASVCTELVAFVEIKDEDKVIRLDTMRLNRRVRHIHDIEGKFIIKDFPGSTGHEFDTLNDSLVKVIAAPPFATHSKYSIIVTGIKKEQYWLNDSINTLYYKKSFEL